MTDIDTLRKVAEAATPGEWRTWAGPRQAFLEADDAAGEPYVFAKGYASPRDDANLAYIAAANPTAVLDLLDRLAVAEAAVARCRALADECDDHPATAECADDDGWRCPECTIARAIRAALDGAP